MKRWITANPRASLIRSLGVSYTDQMVSLCGLLTRTVMDERPDKQRSKNDGQYSQPHRDGRSGRPELGLIELPRFGAHGLELPRYRLPRRSGFGPQLRLALYTIMPGGVRIEIR